MAASKYQTVIGLEVHAQLLTQSKLFCGDSSAFGAAPNTHISPVTLAHPGTLPKMNEQAIALAIKLGLALQCDIEQHNYFARKNYFYPDLPKGYQVSQHTTPICKGGLVPIVVDGAQRNIRLNRIHIEEDAGKSIHDLDDAYTCVDLNRAGVPLLEIVSEPDLHSPEEAYAYVAELRKLVRWLGVCDGNMEEGSLRCDANISIRPMGSTQLGTRVEIKNLNSIRFIKKAIEHEVERLVAITKSGGTIVQETRGYDAEKGITYSMRTKEDADDYRYFPEPDLAPFAIGDDFIAAVKADMGKLPAELEQEYITAKQLTPYDAAFICADKEVVYFFEAVVPHSTHYKAVANWMQGPIKSYLNDTNTNWQDFPVPPTVIAQLVQLVADDKLNFSTAAGKLFPALIQQPLRPPLELATELNLLQSSDTGAIEQWVNEVLDAMPDKVQEYKKGKKGLLGLFTGEVKKRSKGKADIKIVNELLLQKLN
jgi:aspartyl-tRNA(Asn)/glutamyl-tRNA(Gln) amidotransferase subunit B